MHSLRLVEVAAELLTLLQEEVEKASARVSVASVTTAIA
jgi:hypothetical protein